MITLASFDLMGKYKVICSAKAARHLGNLISRKNERTIDRADLLSVTYIKRRECLFDFERRSKKCY